MSENKNLCLPEHLQWIPKEQNIGEFILKHMKLNKEEIVQIDAESGETLTYEKMLIQSISVAKKMKKLGLGEHDIISVCSRNSFENYLPIFASFFLGIKPASLDPSLSLNDTIHLLELTKPRIIFCDNESLDLIETAIKQIKLCTKIVIFGDTNKYLNFNSFLHKKDKIDDNFQIESKQNNEDVAMILFSSGSTGLPKGICLSNYGLLYQTAVMASYRPTEINMNFATSYWISSTVIMLATILTGATRIICPSFQVEKSLQYVEQYKVSTMAVSTTNSFEFTQNPELCSKYDNSSLKYISIAGGRFSDEHLNKMRCLFSATTIIVNVYGMTEISGYVCLFDLPNDRDLQSNKGISCGRPIPGIHLKVLDVHTQNPVSFNEPGELKIKTKTIMKGYYNNLKEYEKQFDEEGYFSTGDIVYYDDDYCFYVVDRIKDMLKYQSWHVTPASIETVLLTHPNILEAIVIGIPHKIDGEHPAAVIVVKPNCIISSDEIIQYVEERVSDSQRLRGGVKFVTELQKTPSGKIRRLEMRQMIINGEI